MNAAARAATVGCGSLSIVAQLVKRGTRSEVEDGDTFDTQLIAFSHELDRFWAALIGPDESLRRSVLGTLEFLADWKRVTVDATGTVRITFNDGSAKTIEPPPAPSAS